MQRNASGGEGETRLHHILLCWVSRWSHGPGGTHRVAGWAVLLVWSLEPISDPNSSSYAVDQMPSVTRAQETIDFDQFFCSFRSSYRAPVKADKLALCHIPSYSSSVLGTNAA